ncbi:MAG: DASS family sodium-coupled anion symporter [Candidatus Bathyarchaeota archaeon]|nr:DASS family sodium-coupled anion symporter [Candidatus Bathyarchaeota archaeon]
MDPRKGIALAAVAVVSIFAFYWTQGALGLAERYALVVLSVAAGLWTTEAIPLVATSLLIPLLQSLTGVQSFKEALSPFFDPVVMLLLGGFLLAIAVEKQDLDEYFAHQILSRVHAGAKIVILVIMATTAFLSMWISNTASTALMLTMTLRLTEGVSDRRGNFPKIVVLSIAYSATAGGLATLVGTTTCAMAVGSLRDLVGYEITFLGWMFFGVPISVLLILVIWAVLFMVFPTEVRRIPALEFESKALSGRQRLTLMVFVFSILLWVTGKLPEPLADAVGWPGHGMSSSVVAAVIAVLLLVSGLVDERDLPRANWNTLLLIGGGLSLGSALEVSGLVGRIGDSLLELTGGRSGLITIALVAVFGLGISIVASNTASASIFLPIAIGLGTSTGVSPVVLAVVVGISTSLDFMLPVGTPPNAIAYSTGRVKMGEMIKAGVILDVVGALITMGLAWLIWPSLI